MDPDAEFDTNAARNRICVSPEDGDIWSLSSQQEPAVAHAVVDYSCRSTSYCLTDTLYSVICAGKIIPNLSFP